MYRLGIQACLRLPLFQSSAPLSQPWPLLSRAMSTNSITVSATDSDVKTINILGESYLADGMTNVTPKVLSKVGLEKHRQKYHPINLIKRRIENYFYTKFTQSSGSPTFAVFDNMSPVVSNYQNFDSLLIPENHPCRVPSDTYYINSTYLLRTHTSAHQEELIQMGCDAFLCVGDVYRRDAIDSSHFPVFHQMEGVRLFRESEVFSRVTDPTGLSIFEDGRRDQDKQEFHSMDAAKLLEYDLKQTLIGVAHRLFGPEIKYRWVDAYFPFTHPSWELEIMYKGEWLEVLGCGIMEQQLLITAGASHKVGWAFGLGLDRLAMKLYGIPDIRLFWSDDTGFMSQFRVENPDTPIVYKPISQHPQCINDVSFWIPENYVPNDFYDIVRSVAGEVAEQVDLIDEFEHPRHKRMSHCYRIVYRHMEKTFTQDEVNSIHKKIEQAATEELGVEIR